jgi:hypothetical protein
MASTQTRPVVHALRLLVSTIATGFKFTDPAFGFLQTTNWPMLLAEPRLINGLLGLVDTPLKSENRTYELTRPLLQASLMDFILLC